MTLTHSPVNGVSKTRIAFIKFGGLAAGGTERWLQMMAANLPRDRFEIEYFYCDPAPYIGWDYSHAPSDPARRAYLEDHGVTLRQFHVGAKDVRTPTHEWRDTDFWDVFDPSRFDLVQTAKAGPAEYPYYLLPNPVVEYVTLDAGVDFSVNIALTIHLSNWQRKSWIRRGGSVQKSATIPIPAEEPATEADLRDELDISRSAVVVGLHQRVDDSIFSPIPLKAFAQIASDAHFVVMGGSRRYQEQAQRLGIRNFHRIAHSGDAHLLSKFLNTLDVFAHGRADGETFGTVLAEAMMHGVPCLSHASPTGNNAQLETMGPGGVFAWTEHEYQRGLKELIDDTPMRERLRIAGLKHARREFRVDSTVEKLSAIYDGLTSTLAAPQFLHEGYGYADGFLVFGPIEEPDTLASTVLSGERPLVDELSLLRPLLRTARLIWDIDAGDGRFALGVAAETAADLHIVAWEGDPLMRRRLKRSVELNRWECRIEVRDPARDLPLERTPDLVRVNGPQALIGLGSEIINKNTIVLISAAPPKDVLEEIGYPRADDGEIRVGPGIKLRDDTPTFLGFIPTGVKKDVLRLLKQRRRELLQKKWQAKMRSTLGVFPKALRAAVHPRRTFRALKQRPGRTTGF